ncbi:rhomboid family intramembrane serine protease [Flavobacterium sp. ALJ2]|uniref:rhomboid family intramembrane serine protease n=1 Tax=Flavobacterium sp. ALJ2 TaxID=2786960 RepID=UPI0018A102F0|nr:rhomboid family intramembrane serine protease [Flavobacterium sp. ALJ2]MBF7090536.1 rhomboid family intramembrane serine protease [Flavobacterium sp. ALJ2]
MMNMTPVVKQLLIINIIFFLGSQLVPVSYEYFSLYFPENYQFKLWQPITHMFMHGGFMHIAFNMFALVSFGSALEHFWGGKKFIFFYISCGLGAALLQLGFNYLQIQNVLEGASNLGLSDSSLHQILNVNFTDGGSYRGDLFMDGIRPILDKVGKTNLLNEVNFKSLFDASIINQTPMVGASGAIYGLLVAFAFMFPNAELALMFIPVPIKAKYFVPGIIAVDLFLGFKGSSLFGSGGTGIAHFAHIGGALVGYLMMWYWKKTQFNNNRWN